MNPPAALAPPIREGEILAGKYRVDRVLGRGGMGVVVAATHLQLDQRVALKFILPQAVDKPEALERFAREAKAAAKLRSEHVARVLDVGTLENGSPYMVMEYLEGCDLAAEVEARGPLPYEDAAEYVLQACEAIAEAHALGIVHRDLKPRNLFLTRRVDGRPLVKVLDFGISKISGSIGPVADPGLAAGAELSLTTTHAMMGSPNYMAPEQLRSARAADYRSDIWALGAMLYELLTGKVPFVATSVTELCVMVIQDNPRPMHELRPDVPRELADAVLKCLEKDPNHRFPSVAALAHALEPFASAHPGAARRILAVAHESIARASGGAPFVLGSHTPSYSAPPSSQGGAAPGKTAVSWAETGAGKSTSGSGKAVIALAAFFAAIVVVSASLVIVSLVVPRGRVASAPRNAAFASAAPKTDSVPVPPTPDPIPVPASVATDSPAAPIGSAKPEASSAKPVGATPSVSSGSARPSPRPVSGGRPNVRRPSDQDTPDERQ